MDQDSTYSSEPAPAPAFWGASIEAALTEFAKRIALVAVISILVIAFATVTDIVLRNFFATSLYGLNEVVTLLVAIGVACCIPYGLASGAAITVDLLSARASKRWQAWMSLLSTALTFLFFAILGWRLVASALETWQAGETTMMTNILKAPFFLAMGTAICYAALLQGIATLRLCVVVISGVSRLKEAALGGIVSLLILHGTLSLLGLVPAGIFSGLMPSSPITLALVSFLCLWVVILLGAPVGVGMGVIGVIGTSAILSPEISLQILGSETSSFVTQDALSVLPLFLLMGAFASVAGIGKDLYALAHALIGHIRGGLAHASILACAGFGTLTGSSVATQMSIGKISLIEMRARNYSEALAAGSIAAGGTLGQLIPPSSALILYAVMTEQSVGQLFVGAIIPGILATLLYMAAIAVWLFFRPQNAASGERSSFHALAKAVRGSWSVILLLGLVLGGIYTGYFTATEAGAVGAVGGFLLALFRGRITRDSFWHTMAQSTQSLATMYSLIFGVTMLSFFFGISGLPQAFVGFVNGFGWPPYGIVLALVLCYLVLGTAMDAYAMMIVTIPIFVPVVVSLGYDPIWWGLMTIVCMEAGMISPPFGLNIFVISSLDRNIKLSTVYRGCWPFFAASVVKILVLFAFPALVTWLPSGM